MSRIDADIWSKLENPRPVGEKLVARRALPQVTDRLYCAIDADGIRHLLVALKPDEDELHDAQSRGVVVDTQEMVVQEQSSTKYIKIECKDTSGYSVLDLIGSEIADELIDERKQPADIVKRVLAKWRRFWGQLPQQMLSREEQFGLFAELWFLSIWLLPSLGPDSIMSWRGPWGSRHDFEWADKSVEIKATTNARGRIHHINGIRQLENPENGPLYLFSLSLREEAGATNNLPKLIENCRAILLGSDDALTRFDSGLLQAGYSPIYQDEYAKLNLRINEEGLFIVDKDFPRIVTESFSNGLPVGIERVEYEINLGSFSHLIVSNSPGQFFIK